MTTRSTLGTSTPLVEHVDGAHGLELAVRQRADRLVAVVRARSGEDRGNPHATLAEPPSHEDCVGDATAEDERACATVVVPGPPQRFHAGLGLHRLRELFRIEALVAPRNVLVVERILEPEVVEGDEASERDASSNVGGVGDAIVEEAEHVASVCAVRGRGQPEQEARLQRA